METTKEDVSLSCSLRRHSPSNNTPLNEKQNDQTRALFFKNTDFLLK